MSKRYSSFLGILAFIFLLIFISLAMLFHFYTEKYAIGEAEKLIQDSLLTHRAIHKYINTVSRPELFRLKNEGLLYKEYFSPKTLSFTYTARGIKNFLNQEREKAGLTKVYFKLASNNPRNEINRADKHESDLLKQMNNKLIEKYREVITDTDGNKSLYVALPTKPITQGCLKCHGDPGDAPEEMVSLYPDSSGYYEKVGDIRALISVRVPLALPLEEGMKISNVFIIITFFALSFLYVLIWFFIYRIDKQHQLIEQKNMELEHMATHDPLTGLANRRHFEEYTKDRLAQVKRRNEKLAILYIDLDAFKSINDDISHLAGDIILKTLGERFRSIVRNNELIARIGGDEFCMIITGYSNTKELENTATRLINESTKPIIIGGMETEIGMSIGIATYPENAKNYDELMSAADDAMYRVKESGKGTFGF